MKPQEIFEHKNRWMPGTVVPVHSDRFHTGIDWCKANLFKYQWNMTQWTDVYEYTFHFENELDANAFREYMK